MTTAANRFPLAAPDALVGKRAFRETRWLGYQPSQCCHAVAAGPFPFSRVVFFTEEGARAFGVPLRDRR